jgi:hypothetical protein
MFCSKNIVIYFFTYTPDASDNAHTNIQRTSFVRSFDVKKEHFFLIVLLHLFSGFWFIFFLYFVYFSLLVLFIVPVFWFLMYIFYFIVSIIFFLYFVCLISSFYQKGWIDQLPQLRVLSEKSFSLEVNLMGYSANTECSKICQGKKK